MERKPLSAPAQLLDRLGEQLPYLHFYRFCQWLEQSQPDAPVIGSHWQMSQEPVRFRPYAGMGFPAAEMKCLELSEQAHVPPSVRVTFMGLYGVGSPLPTHYVDDITQQREGYQAAADFLDIFNHRLIAQYYRIWRKYAYPATFKVGGKDTISQYLLGLAGLGISGSAKQLAMPAVRLLALLPLLLLPTRPAQGLISLVNLLAHRTQAQVWQHDKRRIFAKKPLALRINQPTLLKKRPVMGTWAVDANSQVLLKLTTDDLQEARDWLPGGRLHTELLALLSVYLGTRLDVRLLLCVEHRLLPKAALNIRPNRESSQLGWTAVMRGLNADRVKKRKKITINLGRYTRVKENIDDKEKVEDGGYYR